MEKLERYLDQVCQTIGGPPQMRDHLRQELREHLLDAFAQHKAAGMSEDAAIAKALDEFGKPEEVRSDLEAAHGQRRWFIDKALEWKERTMRAKWLWLSWAHLGLALLIVLEALFIAFLSFFIVPKFYKLLLDGIIDPSLQEDPETIWMINFLDLVRYNVESNLLFWLLGLAIPWGIFEWRVRSENKSYMRLAALATIASALMIVVILTTGSLVVCFCMGAPAMGRIAQPFAIEQISAIDATVSALEDAEAKKDWPAMQEQAAKASWQTTNLINGPALTSIAPPNEPGKAEELRANGRGMRYGLREVQRAIQEHDSARLRKELDYTRKGLDVLKDAAKQSKLAR